MDFFGYPPPPLSPPSPSWLRARIGSPDFSRTTVREGLFSVGFPRCNPFSDPFLEKRSMGPLLALLQGMGIRHKRWARRNQSSIPLSLTHREPRKNPSPPLPEPPLAAKLLGRTKTLGLSNQRNEGKRIDQDEVLLLRHLRLLSRSLGPLCPGGWGRRSHALQTEEAELLGRKAPLRLRPRTLRSRLGSRGYRR
ncbi:hypothetical protein IE53DRAFT_178297 [Violaceomyces palustris]|uniref:Uncharacterized protein n=1 Tax=Violaceomyces palustris TaxID=1673888 RepID=A0ACD0NSK3_9BASI|nr:hypothetical protein IE53DRAFT_178297 [Violaceomyces palustris]